MDKTTEPPPGARRPSTRKPLLVWALPMIFFALAPPLGNYLGHTAFSAAPVFAIIAGLALQGGATWAAIAELNTAAQSRLVWWHLFIPVYGIYWAAVLVPRAMRVAKERSGGAPARGLALYLFAFLYALAADLNDLVDEPVG